ncbi:MAG: GTP-binding protein [Alphaproteobacteria bacterium]|nr:GTP-binding protein [Alphaproteobacteria bacterium]
MRFRTITAPTMEAAMAELRATLGPGAIILSSECARDGKVSLRAAVERAPTQDGMESAPQQETQTRFANDDYEDAVSAIENALDFHRAPQAINTMLLQTVATMTADDPVQALAAAFDTRYGFASIPHAPERPILLIGPAGAGKTITAAKLAARSVLAGYETILITTDLVRTGGAEQLAAYAETMNVPLYRAASGPELTALMESHRNKTTCIIDTTGTSPYNLNELKLLRKFVMAVDCDPVLVLPAGGDAVEACEIVNIFSGLGARGMIVTKLDATRRLGSILGALEAAAMTLHHVSITPFVANGLAPITPAGLARLLLEDPVEHESFSQLEQAAQ